MPPTSPLWLSAIALVFLSVSGFADSVTLKTGEKIQGRILSETATELQIEENISATIKDQRTIQKADIAKTEKALPDIAAWELIKNFRLGPNSLPPASYEAGIRAVGGFAKQFPASPRAEEAKKTLTAFEEEKKRVAAGEVKLSGNWLSKEDAEKERYQINGLVAFNYMKEQATRGDLIGALNSFDILEKNFPGSKSYPDAVELARQVMVSLKAEVDRKRQSLAFSMKEREAGMQLANPAQQAEMLAVQQRDEAAADAAIAAAQQQGLKWPPLIARSEKSLADLAGKVPTEQQALAQVEVPKIRKSIQLTDKAKTAFGARKYAEADKLIQDATSLWAVNEQATRLTAELGPARTEAEAAAAEAAAPPPEPEPAPAAEPAAEVSAEEETPVEKPESETPFLLTPAGAIVVIVLVALAIAAFTVFKKIKGRANDVLE